MELWLRLAAHARVGYIGARQAVYRRHSANMSLAYDGENRLLDLRQREQAIEWLFRSCGHMLPDAEELRRSLLTPLGYQAVSRASGCLNEGKPELARKFVDFARFVFPKVVYSTDWFRFRCKMLIGHHASNVLLSVRDAIRRLARS